MKILFRYIIKETYPPLFLSLSVFSFILLINLLFELSELVVERGFSLSKAILFFLSSLPSLLSYTLPIASLSGVLIAVSRLSQDREIVAMRASGINITSLLKPLVFISFLASIILILFNFFLVPISSDIQNYLLNTSISSKVVVRSLKPKEFFDKIENLLVFVDEFDEKDNLYKNILIYQNPKEGVEIISLAKRGKPIDEGANRITFFLENGRSYTFNNKSPGDVKVSSFEKQILRIDNNKEQSQSSQKKDLPGLSVIQLFEMAFFSDKEDSYPFKYEFFRRIANSIIIIIFVLVAFPLGIADFARGKGASFTISIFLVIFYWVIQSGFGNLSLKGKFDPFLGAFMSTFVFLIASILLNIRGSYYLWSLREKFEHSPLFFKIAKIDLNKREKEGSSFFKRKILDVYLIKYNFKFFTLTLIALISLDFILETRGFIGYLSSNKKIIILFKYLFFRTFALLPTLTPFAILVSVLITIAVLERRSELTAIKSSGISLIRASLPLIVSAILVSISIFVLSETLITYANKKAVKYKDELKNYYSRHLTTDEDVWIYSKDKNILYHYNFYKRKEKIFQGLSIYFLDENLDLKKRFRAKSAFYIDNFNLQFNKGWWWRENSQNSFDFIEKGVLTLPHRSDFLVLPEDIDAQTLPLRKMKKLIKSLQEKGIKTTKMEIDFYKKIADSFLSLVLVLIGLPFAFTGGRKGSLFGITIAIFISFFYMVFTALMKSVGLIGWLEPSLSALFPPILFSLLGIMGILKIKT